MIIGLALDPSQCYICDKMASICETSLVVERQLSMSHPSAKRVIAHRGKLYPNDIPHETATENDAIPENEVIIAGGVQRSVIVFNGTLPGPDIIVYEGQTLFIHVTNRMRSEILGIHWHGLHQRNTPFMDGVPFVTQCPILPGQTFTYKFQAYPKGTFWYYSATGTHRLDGAFGAFIVRSRSEDKVEHILQIQEWYENRDATVDSLITNYEDGVQNDLKINSSKSPDGSAYGLFPPDNALINGRGWTGSLPLHVFNVNEDEASFLFRALGVGVILPFRISIDGHKIQIIESNGYGIKHLYVDSFVLNPGERVDFTISRSSSKSQNYWVRAETLDEDRRLETRAILRYDLTDKSDPNTTERMCTFDNPCKVFNCPFKYFPENENMKCITIDQVDSPEPSEFPPVINKRHFKEYFLNFKFSGATTTSVNGKMFILPVVSALTQPNDIAKPCTKPQCDEGKQCECTYSLSLLHNDTIHFVLTNLDAGKGWALPIHLHGHSFELLKMGFPLYNKTDGNIISSNEDIRCKMDVNSLQEEIYCTETTWSDSSWYGGKVPGLNLVNPPRKDTVIIPGGGYVVIRIKANNPGLWLMHSLVDHLSGDKMAILLNESFPFLPEPPTNFPRCGNFDGSPIPLH